MTHPFETLPRRIFVDSCTAQTMRDYGGYIYEAESIADSDRIRSKALTRIKKASRTF
jgi:hypothetical protein